MWRVQGQNGRIAWFAGDDPAALAELVTELFGDPSSVAIDEVDDPPSPTSSTPEV